MPLGAFYIVSPDILFLSSSIIKSSKKSLTTSYDFCCIQGPITIDIFSTNQAVHIYNYSKTDNYILWKIGKGKQHYLLYYEKTALKHYLNFKSGKKIECIQSIGEKSLRDDLIKLVESFLNSDKNIDNKFYDKFYLYQ